MRRPTLLAFVLFLAVAPAAEAEPVAGPRGVGQEGADGLQEGQIVEEFGEIVELIWTDREEDDWAGLDADDERREFIADFWARRDPTAGTARNEFREIYMARVNAAYREFQGERMEGHRTARGKFFIIYGNDAIVAQRVRELPGSARGPDDIGGGGGDVVGDGADAAGNVGGIDEPSVGGDRAISWVVDPSVNPHLAGKNEVVFTQHRQSYSMSTGGIKLDQEAFLANADVRSCFEDPASCALGGSAGAGATEQPVADEAGAADDTGISSAADETSQTSEPAAGATPDARALRELLNQGATRSDLALDQGLRFFPAPENNTYTVVAFEVGKESLSLDGGQASLTAFGALMRVGEQGERVLRELRLPFTVAEGEGTEVESGTHSFGMTLVPGSYRLAWGVMDDASGAVTTVDESFDVPDYGAAGLTLTSVLVSRGEPEERQEAIDIDTVYEGVRVGSIAADVDIDHTFARDETMMLLYFVMGAQVDPSASQVALEVDHRVLDAQGNGIARLPVQTLNYFVIGQQIPLGQIEALQPGTDYIVRIHVTDTVTGEEITEEVPFHVAGGEE